jgi:uncharacterized protein YuzE
MLHFTRHALNRMRRLGIKQSEVEKYSPRVRKSDPGFGISARAGVWPVTRGAMDLRRRRRRVHKNRGRYDHSQGALTMPRMPIAIERETKYNVAYVRYHADDPEASGRTVGYADYRINVDLNESGRIVGIEILALGAEELGALADIAKKYDLDLSPLIGGTVSSAA